MIDQIKDWASKEACIRTVLLVGSRAVNGRQDKLSDFDISLFGSDDKFAILDDWLTQIGPHLLCIHDRFFWNEVLVPTRLVIFENGAKVDFAFHPSGLLEKMIDTKQLSPTYDSGYQVILDKDDRTAHLPNPSLKAYLPRAPTQEEFSNAWNEFWFEAYHVAKYLHRNDFWVAKVRDESMKKWLLKMLEWNASAKSGFSLSVKSDGKYLRDWIEDLYYKKLEPCFGGWDQNTSITALYASQDLFSEVSKETALILEMTLDNKVENGVRALIRELIPYSHAKE